MRGSLCKRAHTSVVIPLWLLLLAAPQQGQAEWRWDGQTANCPVSVSGPTVASVAQAVLSVFNACNTCGHVASLSSADEQSGRWIHFTNAGFGPPGCQPARYSTGQAVCVGECTAPEKDVPPQCDKRAGNPCNVATGTKYENEVDYDGANTGLVFSRAYTSFPDAYSHVLTNRGLGYGWTATSARKLQVNALGSPRLIVLHRPDGHSETFTNLSGTQQWQGDADTRFVLTEDGNGFTVTLADGDTERYDLNGRLLSETSRSGVTKFYTYDTNGRSSVIAGPFGHGLTIGYTDSGLVESIADPLGRTTVYSYSPAPDNRKYRAEIVADSPQGYWRLKDTGGTTAALEHGRMSNGIYRGSYTLSQEGPVPGSVAAQFDATADGEVDLQSTTNFTSELTLELWTRPNATQPDSSPYLFTKNSFYAASTSDFPVALMYSTTNGFVLALSKGDDYSYDAILTSGAVSPEQWYHVVAVYRSNGQCELWVNGTLANSKIINFSISDNGQPWKIANGIEYSGGMDKGAFSGKISEAALYSAALASSRILAHYNAMRFSNLARVDYPDGTAKLYHYEDARFPHHLTGISYVEANGAVTRYGTYSYDASGRAISTEHAGGQERFTLQYDSDTQTTLTDAANTREVLTFATNLGVKSLITKVNQSDGKSLSKQLDANNNLICKKDEEGRVTTYSYNSSNQRTSMTEGLTGDCINPATTAVTRTTTYQYVSSSLDLPTVIESPSVAPGQLKRTTMTYGDARFPALPTVITRSGHTPAGASISRSVTLQYNDHGQVIQIDGPRTDVADVTTLTYYDCTTGGACGQLKSVTNAHGHVTTYDLYTADGRPRQTTDPNGVRATYEYDGRGRVWRTTETASSGATRVTRYSYNAAGNVTQVIDPDGVTLTYSYDAAQQLRSVTDNLGNRIAYSYDTRGNRKQEYTYDPQGSLVKTMDAVYDLRNRTSNLNDGGNATQQIWDAIGNLVSETDPNANPSTTYRYDALNRLYDTIDRMGKTTSYGYDKNDRLIQITAPLTASSNAVTQYQYDDLGNLLQEVSPDRGTRTYTYDAAGNVRTITDGMQSITTYTYDALNRILTQQSSVSDTPTYAYSYDGGCGKGRLCGIQENGALHLSFEFDEWGRQRFELTSNSIYTTYDYTPGGRLARVTYPDNRIVDYVRNAVSQVTEVRTTDPNGVTTTLASNILHYPFGPLASLSFGNGRTQNFIHDRAYRTSQELSYPWQKTINRDANGNIRTRVDNSGASEIFSYDALDRLTGATDTAQTYADLSYTYDSNGNRLTETRAGTATEYGYAPNSNRLGMIGSEIRTTDAVGQMTHSSVLGNLTFDAYGRLKAVPGRNATYTYDAFNRRLKKTVNGVTTSFHYSPTGELLVEGQGNILRQYVYVDGMPLARIDGGQIYYYHTDSLGTPRAMSDQGGTTVWAALHEPFGAGTVIGSIPNYLHFPGQYRDEETGLHYNWNRYYDPRTGRYVTSDPIGLHGGLNTYAYGNSNPLRYIDPMGLSGAIAIPGAGIGTGVGSGIGTGLGGTLADPIVVPMVPSDYGVPIVEVEDPVTGAKEQCPGPCKGLYNQWKKHELKLKQYSANPQLYDNLGFLAGASPEIQQQIINGRIKNLQRQIENFKKQYFDCLFKHGFGA